MPKGIYLHKKGWHHTEESKKKISEAQKGEKNPAKRIEVREKLREIHLGKKLSEETKRKIKEHHRKFQTEETKKRISKAHKGKKRLPFSKEWKNKLSESRKGDKNPNWNNGSSFEPYSVDWTET